jgi:hypothetical protein
LLPALFCSMAPMQLPSSLSIIVITHHPSLGSF